MHCSVSPGLQEGRKGSAANMYPLSLPRLPYNTISWAITRFWAHSLSFPACPFLQTPGPEAVLATLSQPFPALWHYRGLFLVWQSVDILILVTWTATSSIPVSRCSKATRASNQLDSQIHHYAPVFMETMYNILTWPCGLVKPLVRMLLSPFFKLACHPLKTLEVNMTCLLAVSKKCVLEENGKLDVAASAHLCGLAQ